MFETYQDLLDAARRAGMWHTIMHVVDKAATENYKSAHCGRYNARGIKKEEETVERQFLDLVNLYTKEDRDTASVAALILDSRELVPVAWAVAQRLAGKA